MRDTDLLPDSAARSTESSARSTRGRSVPCAHCLRWARTWPR